MSCSSNKAGAVVFNYLRANACKPKSRPPASPRARNRARGILRDCQVNTGVWFLEDQVYQSLIVVFVYIEDGSVKQFLNR